MPACDQHAGNRTEEDRNKGPGLDQRIAEQQLFVGEEIRQDRVFERAKERGHDPHREQQRQQHRRAPRENPAGSRQHHRNFEQLDQANEPRLVRLVGNLAGGRGAQKKRQNEKAGGKRDQHLRR